MSTDLEISENDKRWLRLRAKLAEENIKSVFRLFRENGLEPVLIKGWAAAREYPESHLRSFSDIDLCVAPDQYGKALPIVSGDIGMNLNIDLHKGLRHLDTIDWKVLFENSALVMLDDVPVRILRTEDHLRVLCVHWLTDGGAYKDRLLDIYYLLQKHAEYFDWEYCFRDIERYRQDWIIKAIAVVHQNYRLDVSKIPFADQLEIIPDWFSKALERAWASDTRLKDIHWLGGNRKELLKQVKLRLRPNPIQAAVLMEGKFDKSFIFYYQVGSFIRRLKASIFSGFQRIKLKIHMNSGNVKKI